jgi:Fe2+ transport system protein FeoA
VVRQLANLAPGEFGTVREVGGEAEIRHRLLEMGLTSGTRVRMIRIAPLGDPVELQLRGYRLSVRKSEAATVAVEAAAPKARG